jgi:superfamily I DNA/RNA helicase
LPLSVTYRCGASIVREANKIVVDFHAAPGARDGRVSRLDPHSMEKMAAPGDFVLSRTNAPLVSLCMAFIRQGRRAMIQGRDVGATLGAFVKKSQKRTVPELRAWVDAWRESECKRLSESGKDTQAAEDKADTLLALSEDAATVADVLSAIEKLFSDADPAGKIILSTTHKAKGLERDRVFLLTDTYRKRPSVEEDNLYYVAVTRAREELYLVAKPREGELRSPS